MILLHFELSHELVKVLVVLDAFLMFLQQRKDKLVEENPLSLKELVKEMDHMLARNHAGKKTKYPLTGVHFCFDVMLYQSIAQIS